MRVYLSDLEWQRASNRVYDIYDLWLVWFMWKDINENEDNYQLTPFTFYLFAIYVIGNGHCLYDRKKLKMTDVHLYGDIDDYDIWCIGDHNIPPHFQEILKQPAKYESMVYVLEYIDEYTTEEFSKFSINQLKDLKDSVLKISELSFVNRDEVFEKYQTLFNKKWKRIDEWSL